jgi:broad specificity phosphatase PhoE
VLASPLTRALQTAQGIFEGHPSAPPLLVEALHRERVEHSGDVGSNPADLARAFPALAFDHLPPVWWHAEGTPVAPRIYVEPIESVADRVGSFRELLRARPERSIAVVGHGTFLYLLTGHIFDNCEIVAFDLDAPLPATP